MGKRNTTLSSFIAATVAVLGFTHPVSAQVSCRDDLVTVSGDFGVARFTVQVADDYEERAQGLMNVPSMPTLSGMLFVYDQPQQTAFWMRNTLISLDMLFADETGTITRIHDKAIPLDETPIPGGNDIQYVLEINGGLAARLGIEEGDVMQHPSMGENAAKPCQ